MVLLSNHSIPSEGIQHTEPNVTLDIEGNSPGSGNLYITESFVLWLNPNNEGLQLEYKLISLHAISRDLQSFPHEHLLCHYDEKFPGLSDQDGEQSSGDEENERDPEPEVVQIRFIPENKESLEAMFEALANCQTLHPDSDCQLSDDDFEDAEEGGGEMIYNSQHGVAHLNEQGQANLERMNQLLSAGMGDADITARTNQLHITNGHHNGDAEVDADQFQDAEGMDE